MGNLTEIQMQIEKLQRLTGEIKTREYDKPVKDILAKMQAFGVTLEDLQQAMGKNGVRSVAMAGQHRSKSLLPSVRRARLPERLAPRSLRNTAAPMAKPGAAAA